MLFGSLDLLPTGPMLILRRWITVNTPLLREIRQSLDLQYTMLSEVIVMFNIILKYMLESKTSYISSIACSLGSQLDPRIFCKSVVAIMNI